MAKKKEAGAVQATVEPTTDRTVNDDKTPPVLTPDADATAGKNESDPQEVSKSEAIRKVLEEMGMETPAEKVKAVLAEKGMTVSTQTIYQARARMKGRGGKSTSKGGGRSGDVDDYEELLTVKEFASEVGGLERLKRLCDVLLRLQD